jgi:hypothetical protein
VRHTSVQSIKDATNILYMTNIKRRGCDPQNFGARILRIRVVVEKIWLKEVLGAN